MKQQNQRGFTLTEIVIVAAVAGLSVAAATSVTIPLIAKESMRSATYDIQTHMQLARLEAVSRNRDTRFIVDTDTGKLEVRDTMGTPNDGDDQLIYTTTLPSSVKFVSPKGGSASTLFAVRGTSQSLTQFSPDGAVRRGSGSLYLHGGDDFQEISVYGAGGVSVSPVHQADAIGSTGAGGIDGTGGTGTPTYPNQDPTGTPDGTTNGESPK